MVKNIKKRWLIILSAIGPGLFLIGYNIGTGSITTMAKTGAEHGMELFWALVLSVIFTFILIVAYGKVTLVSGKTALTNIKQEFRYGWILALYILIALIIGELFGLMGLMGIVADLINEGIRLLFNGLFVHPGWIILFMATMIFILLWFGNYKIFEKILTGFVIFMGLSFIVVFFMVSPDFSVITDGLIPGIPDVPGAMGLVAAIAGTTCSAAVFIMRSTVVAEKGWTIKDLDTEKKDALVSVSMMLFLSAVIMAVSAGTLHVTGSKLDNTVEMIQLFEPIGGKIAAFVLILGIVGAGLSTSFPLLLIAPWLISDYTETTRNIHSSRSRLIIFFSLLFAFGSIFLSQQPPALMVFSMAFQACILPAVAIPIMVLMNRNKLMGIHTAGITENTGLIAVILFSFMTTWFAITELLF
jgi:manganese transport protein